MKMLSSLHNRKTELWLCNSPQCTITGFFEVQLTVGVVETHQSSRSIINRSQNEAKYFQIHMVMNLTLRDGFLKNYCAQVLYILEK